MAPAIETVEIEGHIIDSLILAKVMDVVLAAGADYEIESVEIGKTNRELWDKYGLAIGGAVAPAEAATDPKIDGLIGGPATPICWPRAAPQRLMASRYSSMPCCRRSQARWLSWQASAAAFRSICAVMSTMQSIRTGSPKRLCPPMASV